MLRSAYYGILFCLIASLPAICGCLPASSAQGEAKATGEEEKSPSGGSSLQGRVRYQADPERRWQDGKDYIKDPKKGYLKGAVILLQGAGLEGATAGRKPETTAMDQENFLFVPETIAIRAGDSVQFTNSDGALHNILTLDGSKPFNVTVPTGKDYLHTFEKAGGLEKPIRLSCIFHAEMKAWIYVFEHRFYQVTGADGQFQLENVPAGKYTLTMIHPAGALRWTREIEVEAGKTVDVEVIVSPDEKEKRIRKRG